MVLTIAHCDFEPVDYERAHSIALSHQMYGNLLQQTWETNTLPVPVSYCCHDKLQQASVLKQPTFSYGSEVRRPNGLAELFSF